MAHKKKIQTYDAYLRINDIDVDQTNVDENDMGFVVWLFMEEFKWKKKIKKMDSVEISIEPGIKEEK